MTTLDPSLLAAVPRVALAHLPTPLEPLPHFSAQLGGPQVWIKRDDLTGLATGGNKTRKLEFLMAQALEVDADCVITAGSTQSNHARQTAAAAAKLDLACCLAIYAPGGQPVPPAGNLLLSNLLGATIHWTDERAPYTRTIAQIEARRLERGQTPYVIPYGGSNAFGLLGYAAAMAEVVAQTPSDVTFDAHIFASSSGGTQAGLILGAALAGLPPAMSLLGISVDRPAADLARTVADLASSGAALLGCDWRCDPADVQVNADYLGGGYAVVGPAEREAIHLLARTEGILVDPVYTGRALAGLIDLIRQGAFTRDQRVLFWHTGGTAALDAFAAALV